MYRFNRMIILLVMVMMPGFVFAGSDHYKNILIGDRAATMGGAFTAVSDDASGYIIISGACIWCVFDV